MTENFCEPRQTRRIPGLPFGLVTNGGDRSFNNLSVASNLSVGSQAVVPLLYVSEIASLANLDVTVCENFNVAAKDGTFSFGDNFSIVANNTISILANDVVIDGNTNVTVSAGDTLTLNANDIVVTGNFVVPNINACALGCNTNLNIDSPTVIINGNLLVNNNATFNNNVFINGELFVCNISCPSGNLTFNDNVTVNGNFSTTNLTVTNNISGNNLTITNNISSNNLTVNNDITSNNLTVNNNLTSNNLTVTHNLIVDNATVNNNFTSNNLTVNNNLTTNNLTVNNNISTNNLTVTHNVIADNVTVNATLTANTLILTGLTATAPTQLVDYNVSSGHLGYVTNAVLAVGSSLDNVMGWNVTASTPSKFAIASGGAAQLFTRNAGTGAYVTTPAGSLVGSAPATIVPLAVDSATNNVSFIPDTQFLWISKSIGQSVAAGTTDIILYDFSTVGSTVVTYAGGVFTFLRPGTYSVSVTCTTDTTSTGSYVSARIGSTPTANEVARTGPWVTETTHCFSFFYTTPGMGGVFCVTFTNGTVAPASLTAGGGSPGLLNDVKVSLVQF